MEKYSFQEVIRQFKRGCMHEHGLEGGCPFFPICNIGHCRKIAFEHPDEFERRVMDWAKEHPEPQYPTWLELMKREGLAIPCETAKTVVGLSSMAYDQIPADIAERLGIKPKEG